MNEALNEAVYERFRFIEWDIILASIHSLFKGSIQPSNASYCSPTPTEKKKREKPKEKIELLIISRVEPVEGLVLYKSLQSYNV